MSGAAILTGLPTQEAALAAGRAVLGQSCRRFGPRFEATKDKQEAEAAQVAEQPADERGRKRRFTATQERMVAHNDGFGFGGCPAAGSATSARRSRDVTSETFPHHTTETAYP